MSEALKRTYDSKSAFDTVKCKFLDMGPPRFELESLAPKAKRIDQATLRAHRLY